MKHFIKLFVLLTSVFLANNAIAGEDITGTWQGTLVPAPGNELAIQFIINKNADGSYSVMLNSPDQGAIKNIKASSVVYDSGKLKLDVTELSGSYEGFLKGGEIEGNWKQEGSSIPLNLSPYIKPVLTKEDMDKLLGQWHGKLNAPSGSYTLIFKFNITKEGEFEAFVDNLEAAAYNIPVIDVELVDNELKLKIPAVGAEYKGKLANDEIVGELKQGSSPLPVTLKKGEYKAPTFSLKLPKETMELLSGKWKGKLGNYNLVFRFEKNEKGEFLGFIDSPDIGAKDVQITDATMSDGKLILKVKLVNAEFKGELSDGSLAGEWTQAGRNTPLTLKKE